MALRGLSIEAIHFHSYPYTSKEALEKVRDLARTMARFTGPVPLHVVPFTDVQIRIKEKAEPNVTTLFLRAAMMTAADILAKRRGCGSLVTGESLGQVASQTQESIRFSQSFSDLPVMRPLIGMDKHYAMDTARRIGTYEISIRPFEDCCVLFSPKHPLLNPDLAAERLAWAAVEAGPLIEEALSKAEFSVIREGAGR
jgi:thiamine biosynthesis protein ThiI